MDAPRKKTTLSRMVMLRGALLFVLRAIAWFVLSWRMAGLKSESESRARDKLASGAGGACSLSSERRQLSCFTRAVGRPGTKRSTKPAVGALYLAIHARQARQRRPREELHFDRASRQLRIPQFLHRRDTGVLHATREDRAARQRKTCYAASVTAPGAAPLQARLGFTSQAAQKGLILW